MFGYTVPHRLLLGSGRILLLFVGLGLGVLLFPSAFAKGPSLFEGRGLALPFVENRGQWPRSIRYLARTSGYQVAITPEAIEYRIGQGVVRERPVGSRPLAPVGEAPAPTRVSYFMGKEPTAWAAGLPSWQRLRLGEPWPGTRLEVLVSPQGVEKVFRLEAEADVKAIVLQLENVDALQVAPDGGLLVKGGEKRLRFTPPRAWQEIDGRRVPVAVSYRLVGENRYGFELGDHAPDHGVIIDPALEVSTLIGGDGDEAVVDLARDESGKVYLLGWTEAATSEPFPVTSAAYDGSHNGSRDLFIARFSSDLATLEAATFFGGSGWDTADALLVAEGAVYVSGYTNDGTAFPTTSGAYQTTPNGYRAAFVARFDGALSALQASTLFDPQCDCSFDSDTPRLVDLARDAQGNLYAAGWVYLPKGLPEGGYDNSANGLEDAVLLKFSSALDRLEAVTLLGGENDDRAYGLAVSSQGDLYVVGTAAESRTAPTTFPTTVGAWQPEAVGCRSGFVARFDADLKHLRQSTLLGVKGTDTCGYASARGNTPFYDIALDPAGRPYVVGGIDTLGLPKTGGYRAIPYEEQCWGYWGADYTCTDLAILRLDANLSKVEAATYLGGSGHEIDTGSDARFRPRIAVLQGEGEVLVATTSQASGTNAPVTPDAAQRSNAGGWEGYVAKLSPDLDALLYGTFLGGEGNDFLHAIQPLDGRTWYLAGTAAGVADGGEAFPTTEGAFDRRVAEGDQDGFVARVKVPEGLAVMLEGPRNLVPGTRGRYLVRYRNTMTVSARSPVVVVDLPPAMSFIVTEEDEGLYYTGERCSNRMFWKLPDLAPGETGELHFTMEVPAGAPQVDFKLTARIGAANWADSPFSVTDYLDADPIRIVESRRLTEDEIDQVLAARPALGELMDYVRERNYGFFGQATWTRYGSGEEQWRFYLVAPGDGAPAVLFGDGEVALVEVYRGNTQVLFDTGGGVTWDRGQGRYETFGSWALDTSLRDARLRAFSGMTLRGAGFSRCFLNCTLELMPEMAFSKLHTLYSMVGYSIDCIKCAQAIRGGNYSSDDCVKCSASTVELIDPIKLSRKLPALGDIVNATLKLKNCSKDCAADPDKYVCTQDKYDCNCFGSWATSFIGVGGVCKTTCNRAAGIYAAASYTLYCPIGERCVASACNATGYESCCVPDDEVCPPNNSGCHWGDGTTRPAHDPNAKSADPAGGVTAGQTIDYRIQYENTGSGEALGVFIVDELPEGLDASTLVIGNGGDYSADSRLLTWEVGDLAPGEQGEVSFRVKTRADLAPGTRITNQAKIYFPNAAEITPTNLVVHTVAEVAASDAHFVLKGGELLDLVLQGSGPAPLSYELLSRPLQGTLEGTAPNLRYTPREGFAGIDRFSFRVVSAGQASAPAEVVLEVEAATADATPPQVIDHWPKSDALGIRADDSPRRRLDGVDVYGPPLRITFSEPMDAATLDDITLNGSPAFKPVWDAATGTVELWHTYPLTPGTSYRVEVGTGVRDLAGNGLAEAYTWRFTTAGEASLGVTFPAGLDHLDFGKLSVVKSEEQGLVTLFNRGTGTLRLDGIEVQGTGFELSENGCGATLEAGAHCLIAVTFQPPQDGDFTGTLTVRSSDPDRSTFSASLRGSRGAPALEACRIDTYALAGTYSGDHALGSTVRIENSADVVIESGTLLLKAPEVALKGRFQVKAGARFIVQSGSVTCTE